MKHILTVVLLASLFWAPLACQIAAPISGAAAVALEDVPIPYGFRPSQKAPGVPFVVAGESYRAGKAVFLGNASPENALLYMNQALPTFGWSAKADQWVKGHTSITVAAASVNTTTYGNASATLLTITMTTNR